MSNAHYSSSSQVNLPDNADANSTSSVEQIADLRRVLADLHQRYQAAYAAASQQPMTDYIDEWSAPCYAGDVRYGLVPWQAVLQQPTTDFSGVEQGLECTLDTQLKAFYQGYFAADLYLSFDNQPIVLSQVMCVEDVERLQRNLIAHVLMKRRLGQPVTLFLGTSDVSEDLIISVDNATGEVGLEYVGKPQHAVLTHNVAEFLTRCQPRVVVPE